MFSLAGKKALIGIANEDSIAFGCARAFRAQGAELAITFQNEKAEHGPCRGLAPRSSGRRSHSLSALTGTRG